jgi:hypothetical protein
MNPGNACTVMHTPIAKYESESAARCGANTMCAPRVLPTNTAKSTHETNHHHHHPAQKDAGGMLINVMVCFLCLEEWGKESFSKGTEKHISSLPSCFPFFFCLSSRLFSRGDSFF